jgi:hypothetical protein
MFLLVENEPERICRTMCRDRSPVGSLVKQMKSEEHRHKIYTISGFYRAAKRERDQVGK